MSLSEKGDKEYSLFKGTMIDIINIVTEIQDENDFLNYAEVIEIAKIAVQINFGGCNCDHPR